MATMLEKHFSITSNDTAASVGSSSLDVLSTPSLIAFMENTAMHIAEDIIDSGQTTVGIEIDVKHFAPSAVGDTVIVEATLLTHMKNTLTYDIKAYDEKDTELGSAKHKRAIVEAEAFMSQFN